MELHVEPKMFQKHLENRQVRRETGGRKAGKNKWEANGQGNGGSKQFLGYRGEYPHS